MSEVSCGVLLGSQLQLILFGILIKYLPRLKFAIPYFSADDLEVLSVNVDHINLQSDLERLQKEMAEKNMESASDKCAKLEFLAENKKFQWIGRKLKSEAAEKNLGLYIPFSMTSTSCRITTEKKIKQGTLCSALRQKSYILGWIVKLSVYKCVG